ncbi:MAG: histidine phosphatase family protein [Caldisericia bacterium]
MKTIFFVRHGESVGNKNGLICGTHDSILTETGRAQANLVGKFLKTVGIDRIISSDLLRAKETAEIINQYLDAPISFDPRIRERACGIFDGRQYTEVNGHAEWEPFLAKHDHKVEGGESLDEVFQRSSEFLKDLVSTDKTEKVLLSSHGGILWVMVPFILGYSIREHKGTIGMDNCGISVFSWNGEFALERLNCTKHLGDFADIKQSWRFE